MKTQQEHSSPVKSRTSHEGAGPRRRNYAPWRAASLILVYVLMTLHLTHWLIAKKTLAPLELNEVMYTFELGVVTAGFLFMAAAVLATMFFGRFFCSWGCHILALQDLSSWILRKLHIKPRAIRSRALAWIPLAAALYMFVWPQATRLWHGRPLPELHLRTDAEGWASLSTENFWRNLPSPAVTASTFLVCGFLIVFVLGSRSFCSYGCPYGVVFGLADRLAPGRIRLRGGDCLQCGACTAACSSHVRVHEELNRHGTVVNSACLKDLDCVSACPKQNVFYGFGRPSILTTVRNDTPVRKQFDFTIWEECVVVLVFLAVLVIFRGLYDLVPFLLTLGMGGIAGYLAVVVLRLAYRPFVPWTRWRLKVQGRMTRAGWAYVTGMGLCAGLSMHSAFVHYHSFQGRRLAHATSGGTNIDRVAAEAAIAHLGVSDRWGLVPTAVDRSLLADLHYRLAEGDFRAGRRTEAGNHLREVVSFRPNFAAAHVELGALAVEGGELTSGIGHLRQAIALQPDHADAHHNLAVALAMSGRYDEAAAAIERAQALNPDDEQIRRFREFLASALQSSAK